MERNSHICHLETSTVTNPFLASNQLKPAKRSFLTTEFRPWITHEPSNPAFNKIPMNANIVLQPVPEGQLVIPSNQIRHPNMEIKSQICHPEIPTINNLFLASNQLKPANQSSKTTVFRPWITHEPSDPTFTKISSNESALSQQQILWSRLQENHVTPPYETRSVPQVVRYTGNAPSAIYGDSRDPSHQEILTRVETKCRNRSTVNQLRASSNSNPANVSYPSYSYHPYFSPASSPTSQLRKDERKPFVCPSCPQRFRSMRDFKNHRKLHIAPNSFDCYACSSAFLGEEELVLHMEKYHGHSWPFKCISCGNLFTQLKILRQHEEDKHPETAGSFTLK